MSTFSVFQDFVAFSFTGAPTRGERIYESMITSEEKAFDVSEGTYEEARIYASAMGIARARYALERALNQSFAKLAVEMLPHLEEEWSCIPKPTDTIYARQEAVALKRLLPRGARAENVEAQLRAIYDDDFIAYRVFNPAEVYLWPEQPFDGPGVFVADNSVPKHMKLEEPIVLQGERVARYLPIVPGDPTTIEIGDLLCIEVENLGLAEKVTVLDAGEDSRGKWFKAIFSRAHGYEASVTTDAPIWLSTQRRGLIVVKESASLDADKYRRACDVLQSIFRTVTEWAIVHPTTDGATTIGPFTLNVSEIGATTIEELAIIPPATGGFPQALYEPSIVVSTISPSMGNDRGGTAISITGSGFTTVTQILFGDTPLASYTIVNDGLITGVTDAHVRGPVHVQLIGTNNLGLKVNGFEYVDGRSFGNVAFWVRADKGVTLDGTNTLLMQLVDQSDAEGSVYQSLNAVLDTTAPLYFPTQSLFNNRAAWGTSLGTDETRYLMTLLAESLPQPFTIYQVYRLPTPTSPAGEVHLRAYTDYALLWGGTLYRSGGVTRVTGDGSTVITPTTPLDTTIVQCDVYDGTQSASYVNAHTTTAASGNVGTGFAMQGLSTGTMGSNQSRYLNAEIIVFAGSHNQATREKIMSRYLGDAYAVSIGT